MKTANVLRAKHLVLSVALAVMGLFWLFVAIPTAMADPIPLIDNSDFDTDVSGWFLRGDSPCGSLPTWGAPGRANLSCNVDFTHYAHTFYIDEDMAGEIITVSWHLDKAGSSGGSYIAVEIEYEGAQDEIWERTNIAGDWTEEDVWIPASVGTYTITVLINNEDSWIDYVRVIGDGVVEPPPPPPPTGPVDPGATCSFNYSTTITSTGGTTVTEQYSYTVAANLVSNYSFEESDGLSPVDWTVVGYEPPIGIFSLLFYGSGIFEARSGLRYVRPGGDDGLLLSQDMPLYASGIYQVGFYYRCSEFDGCSFYNAANLNWEGNAVASVGLGSTNSPTYYVTISDTVVSAGGGGSAWLALELFGPVANWEDDEIFVDDLFIWPVDESGEILCSPEYYPVPEPITTTNESPSNCTATFGGLCFPPVLDASCWNCQRPSSFLAIGEWIAWLFCHIRNLFFCHLYHWILAVMNWVAGLWNNLVAFFNWLPTVGQSILNWIVGAYNNVIAWFAGLWERIVSGATNWLRTLVQNLLNTNLVQAIFNFVGGLNYIWDLFASLAQLFVDFMRGLFNAILDIINLFIMMVEAIREAIATPAYEWDFSEVDPAAVTREAAYTEQASRGTEGTSGTWSDTEIMYIFLIALATGDQVLSSFGMGYIQFLIIGGLSVTLIFWTLRKWEYILPI